ncbi:MAG: cysteine hydrolase [Agathobacter sp.]|nr:cysteine hydrolase [Agathobacter sp.]
MSKKDLLLVVDMQNIYTEGQEWACLNTRGAALHIQKIINSGRCQDVIFTCFLPPENPQGVWKDYNIKYAHINANEWGNEMLPEFAEALTRYPLYSKSVYSSLAIPEVLAAAKKADRVIITGVVAECCVLSTVWALIDEGIYTVYVTDAVSGFDVEKEEAARLVLSGLSPLHVAMMTTEEYLNEI